MAFSTMEESSSQVKSWSTGVKTASANSSGDMHGGPFITLLQVQLAGSSRQQILQKSLGVEGGQPGETRGESVMVALIPSDRLEDRGEGQRQ